MDERVTFQDIRMIFTNDQKAGKTRILFRFEELDEKPTELQLTVPNPYASRVEMITYLQRRVNEIITKLNEHMPSAPTPKEDPANPLDEFDTD